MLDHAAANQSPDDMILRQQANAFALPFEGQIFDFVVCQFSATFFPDKLQGLKPGGKFLFNIWDGISENQFAGFVAETL